MLIGIGVKAVVEFLFGLVVSRTFGAEVLGSFSIANTIFNILALVSLIGFNLTLNKFLPLFTNDTHEQTVKRSVLIGTVLKYVIVVSVSLMFLIFLAAPKISDLFDSAYVKSFLRILIIGLPAFTFVRILVSITTSLENARYEALIEKSFIPLFSLGALLIFIITDIGSQAIPLAYFLAYIVGFIVSFFATYRLIISKIDFHILAENFDKKYIYFTIPLFLNNLFVFLILWLDSLFLGYFIDETSVGIYSIAKKVGSLPLMTITAFNIVFLPTLSKIVSQGKIGLVRMYYKDSVRILTTFTAPITLFMILFAKEILLIFGKEFEQGATTFALICIGVMINIASGPIGKLLIAYNKQRVITISTLIAFIFSTTFSLILIPRFGLIGAGVSYIIGETLQNYIGLLYLFTYKQISPYSAKNIKLFVAIALLSVVIIFIKQMLIAIGLGGDQLVQIIVLLVSAAIIYGLLLIFVFAIFSLIEPKDKKLLLSIIKKFKTRKNAY